MRRDLWAYLGMLFVAGATAVWSFDSLMGLARLAGAEWMAVLLPLAIDGYALTSTRVWLRVATTDRTKRYACANSFTAIALSVVGNVAYHGFTAAGIDSLSSITRGWIVAATIAAVPPAALYAVVHLWSLVASDQRASVGPPTDPARVPAEAPATALVPARADQPSRSRREKAETDRRTRAGSPTTSTSGQAREYARTRHAAGDPVKAPDL